MTRLFALLCMALSLVYVAAECPNACSAHGRCGDKDACECYRNWMSNDCSERVCQFGLAHVDSPKGDLDASSGALSGRGTTVVSGDEMYPVGTTEQFPAMKDSMGVAVDETAHYYMECSNKGTCDRDAGECVCFDGYEGSACQRASCPITKAGVCSGHGTCRSIAALAASDASNHYQLWDQDATMGCECDAGYTGPSCADRLCKYGFDPLYYDDENTVRYSNFTFAILNYDSSTVFGTFSLVFYDAHGEDWETEPIQIDDVDGAPAVGANSQCDVITTALENIPNDVIPDNSVLCHMTTDQVLAFDDDAVATSGVDWEANTNANENKQYEPITALDTATRAITFETKFILAFPGNPGYLKQPEINIYLDGGRPSLYTDEDTSTLRTWVFPNGFQGEDMDYVPDLCADVRVSLVHDDTNKLYKLGFENAGVMKNLFKTCLGEGDANPATIANDIYQWDYGTIQNPHLIKLVDTTVDPASPLCSQETSKLERYIHYKKGTDWREGDGGKELGEGWCVRNSPPGFYAIVYYDLASDIDDESDANFYVYNRAGDDFPAYAYRMSDGDETAQTVYFNVFTTTGTLQIISTYVQGVTAFHSAATGDAAKLLNLYDTYHSNVLYTYFADEHKDSTAKAFDISCEFSSALTHSFNGEPQLACLEKGDLVFLLNILAVGKVATGNGATKTEKTFDADGDGQWGDLTSGYNNNPKYLNMYRVAKIGREYNYVDTTDETSMLLRNKITFEQSINFAYALDTYDSVATDDNFAETHTGMDKQRTARIYKFTPPTNTIQNTYAAECSTRGVCNREDGVCECFAGYTGDSCNMQNALAE